MWNHTQAPLRKGETKWESENPIYFTRRRWQRSSLCTSTKNEISCTRLPVILILAKKFSDVRKDDGDWQSSAAIHYLNTDQRCELHSLMMLWQTQRFRITPLILLISCHGDNAILRHDESGKSCSRRLTPPKKMINQNSEKKTLILFYISNIQKLGWQKNTMTTQSLRQQKKNFEHWWRM